MTSAKEIRDKGKQPKRRKRIFKNSKIEISVMSQGMVNRVYRVRSENKFLVVGRKEHCQYRIKLLSPDWLLTRTRT